MIQNKIIALMLLISTGLSCMEAPSTNLDLRNPHSNRRSPHARARNDALSLLVAESMPSSMPRIQPPGSHPFDDLLVTQLNYRNPTAKYPTLYKPPTNLDPMNSVFALMNDEPPANLTEMSAGVYRMVAEGKVMPAKDNRLDELIKWQNGKRFNTKYLRNFGQVREDLIKEEGFEPVEFTTRDNLKIAGLWKDRGEEARCNIAISCGFIPGNPMGMATLYDSFPDWCNLLFIYARGHGPSEGSLKRSLWETKYAEGEPLDIMAALAWMHQQHPDLANIPYGTCSGGFHSINALLLLQEEERIADLHIPGALIDSAWATMEEVGYNVARNHMKGWNNGIYYYFLSAVYQTLLKRGFTKVEAERNLLNGRMANFPPEVLLALVHGTDDPDVDIESIRNLQRVVLNSSLWEVSNAGNPHAAMQLKCKHEYALWLRQQIEKMLNPSRGYESDEVETWEEVED
ncbi:hypothetical protein HOM50_02615 [bacterium]|jgi:hypothetical protein|nr:hypothetical protein [bacterium]MBT5015273.1 hypothetical protein [bacterium]